MTCCAAGKQALPLDPYGLLCRGLSLKFAAQKRAMHSPHDAWACCAAAKQASPLGPDGLPIKKPRGRPKGSKNKKTLLKLGGEVTPSILVCAGRQVHVICTGQLHLRSVCQP